MSVRRSTRRNRYRTEYLRSPVWFARRDRWFHDEAARGNPLACALCPQTPDNKRDLELHHLDYKGVIRTDAGWLAKERHGDLLPCHPRCHELLHRLIDRDRVLGRLRGRRNANLQAIALLRRKLQGAHRP